MSKAPRSPGPEEENYEIGRQLARGGMGSVMVADDRNLGRRVALKVMSLDAWSDPALRRRFVREARVLAHLAHPNIVPIYDLVWEDGIPQFYTMKLVEGRTLQEILDGLRKGERECQENFSLDGLLTVFLKVCDAIAFAHSQGVIHRDLKPDNIMVGEFGEVLVMDWGLAGLIDDLGAGRLTSLIDGLATEAGPGPIELTLQGEVMGSPRYMSPEQAAGRVEEFGPRSDIFSLGGILYTILTLHPPVDGASAAEVLKKLLGGDIAPPSEFASSSQERMIARPGALASRRSRKFSHCPGGKIPPGLSAVAMHALALDPAERYPDAEVLAADINAHRGGFSTSVQKVNAPGQLLLLMKRHKVMSGSALLLLLVSVCFIVGLARSAEAERRSAEVARRTAYSASLAQALAAREHHDFGKARRLLAEIEPGRRGFDWRLVNGLCQGDDLRSFRLGDGAGSVPQCFYLFPDGLRIAILSADGRLHLLDLDGREVAKPRRLPALHLASQSLELQSYYGLKVSPDGLRLAYANGDVLQVIDAVSFEVLHQEISRRPQFDWLDDQRLLYGFNGSVARPPYPEAGAWILDFGGERGADGRFPRTAFPEMCAPLAVSADRRFFVLHWVDTNPTSWERRLNVFPADANPGDEPILKHLMPGLDYPGLLAFSPGGRYLAYTGGLYNFLSRSAHVLELPGGRMLFDQKFQVSIHGLAIDPEERLLGVAGGDTVVRLYDFTRGSPEPAYANTYDDGSAFARCEPVIGKAAHAPPRDLVTRTAQDGRARFFLGHEERVLGISFAPTGALFTAGPDGLVRQWISNTGNTAVPAVRIGHMESTYQREQPAASVDGAHLLYLVGSTTLHCDVGESSASGHEVVTTVGERHAPLAVLRDGRPITLARDDSVVVLWEKIDGKFREQRSFRDPSARLPRVGRPRRGVLSHDETRLAGALPGQLFTVDLVSGRMEVSGDFGQRTGSLGVASHDLSPDGNWIASSGFGVRISIHRFEEPGEIVALVGGEKRGFDTAAAFGRDGRLLYTGNEDGRVRVWNTKTWTEIPELGFAAHRGAISAITVSHDGTLLATSGASTLKLFPIAPEAGVSDRRERISFEIDQPANWIQFARGADGGDTALLHSSPARTLEVWNAGPGDRDRMTSDFVPEEAGDLPRPLAHHGMVALSDGRVLVAGGEGTTRNELPVCRSECFLYDPASNAWSRTGSLRSPRSRRLHPILLGDGKVLVAGGMGTENHPLASCELYDPKSGRWLATGPMLDSRSSGAWVLLQDGRVLAIAGATTGGVALATCELYDPRTGQWTVTAPLRAAASSVSAIRLQDGRVLALADPVRDGADCSCELYDPATGSWSPAAPPSEARYLSLLSLLPNAEVLAIGGVLGTGDALTSCERFDPVTDTWRATGALSLPAQEGASSVTSFPGRRVLLAGGYGGHASVRAESYDPQTGQWSPAPDLASPRRSHEAALLPDGRALLVGGLDDKGLTNRVEVYTP